MKLLAAMFLTVLSCNAFATAEEAYYDRVHAAVEAGDFEMVDLDLKELTSVQQKNLYKAAYEEFNVWGDTILEGDYALDPDADMKLSAVEKMMDAEGEFISYRIVFSHAAFDTSSCDVDWDLASDDPRSFKEQLTENCTSGNISEGAYVSPDYKFQFRDEDAIADFSD